jgi:hypothetical protein
MARPTSRAALAAVAALALAWSLLAGTAGADTGVAALSASESRLDPKTPAKSTAVDTLASVQWFRNEHTGMCMTALGMGLAPLRAADCEYTNPLHLWEVTVRNDGTRQLRGHSPQMPACIESASTGTGPNAILNFACDASTWQSWYVDRWNDGTIRFRNQSTGLCLGHYLGNYYTITQEICDKSTAQSWY